MITLGNVQDFTDQELAWLKKSSQDVNDALADPAFISILMGATYDNTTDDNATIVKNITAAITVDKIFCENLGWYATNVDHTIAEEDTDGTITCNRPFFDTEDEYDRANTLFHECCHVAGYSHYSASDSASVPYQAGNLLEAYFRKKYEQQPQS